MWNLRISICWILSWAISVIMYGDDKSESYISQYKAIAISEMHRSGIPASIKLAQGLLESNRGTSTLATSANNHFGIKCGKHWQGGTYYIEDDDFEEGKLIKSCFRAFADSYQSYIAHSDFLTNPKSSYRYGHLFLLDPSDYKSWAKGLKKSGYATDPKYPQKLISLIEKYELYQYDDQAIFNEPIVRVTNPVLQEKQESTVVKQERHTKSENIVLVENTRKESNTIDQTRSSMKTEEGFHKVSEGETIASIAQRYRISERELYAFNRIPTNSAIKTGSLIKIDGYLHWGERAEFVAEVKVNEEEELLFADEVVETF